MIDSLVLRQHGGRRTSSNHRESNVTHKHISAALAIAVLVLVPNAYAGFTDAKSYTSPAQEARELEAEIAYRCVLWGHYQQLVSVGQAWEPVRESAWRLSQADRAFQRQIFESFLEVIWITLIITPNGVEVQDLTRLSQKEFGDFNFARAFEEITRVVVQVRTLAASANLSMRDNDERLRTLRSRALDARIPEDCPSSQEP